MTGAAQLDQELLRRLAASCGHAYLAGARACGRPWRVTDDVMMSDLGLPVALPPNHATFLRAPDSVDAAMGAIDDFFAAAPGGGYQVWSLWPGVDLAPFGLAGGRAPCMVRPAAGEPRAAPPELELSEVGDDAGMREVWALIDEVFAGGRAPEPRWDGRVLGEDYRVWIGRVDGRAVVTATASISHGFVGVYCVATRAEARGRGYGEAATWAATLCRPDLPATLQASPMGQPVYARMGYQVVTDFTVWRRAERRGPGGQPP